MTIRTFSARAMQRSHYLRRRRERSGPRRVDAAGEIRCDICGTQMLSDDPIGLVRGRLAHAECSLVHWLVTGETDGRRLEIPARADGDEAEQRRRQLLEALLSTEV